MNRVRQNLGGAGGGAAPARREAGGRGIVRVVFGGLAFPVIFVFILLGMFVYAARWLGYFGVALLAMVWALGSKQYVNYFPLAFLAPLFVGGLIDWILLLIESPRQRRGD